MMINNNGGNPYSQYLNSYTIQKTPSTSKLNKNPYEQTSHPESTSIHFCVARIEKIISMHYSEFIDSKTFDIAFKRYFGTVANKGFIISTCKQYLGEKYPCCEKSFGDILKENMDSSENKQKRISPVKPFIR